MFGSSNQATSEMKSLVKEAQKLFRETNTMSNSKASDLRTKGLKLLDAGIEKAQDAQAYASRTGKEIATSTNDFVHESPWRAIAISGAIAVGVGLLMGLLVQRNK